MYFNLKIKTIKNKMKRNKIFIKRLTNLIENIVPSGLFCLKFCCFTKLMYTSSPLFFVCLFFLLLSLIILKETKTFLLFQNVFKDKINRNKKIKIHFFRVNKLNFFISFLVFGFLVFCSSEKCIFINISS